MTRRPAVTVCLSDLNFIFSQGSDVSVQTPLRCFSPALVRLHSSPKPSLVWLGSPEARSGALSARSPFKNIDWASCRRGRQWDNIRAISPKDVEHTNQGFDCGLSRDLQILNGMLRNRRFAGNFFLRNILIKPELLNLPSNFPLNFLRSPTNFVHMVPF